MYAKCKNGAECVQKQGEFLKKEQDEKLKFIENKGLSLSDFFFSIK
jgi:hypothetical protein